MRLCCIAGFVCICIFLGGCTRFDLLNATVPSGNYLRTADIPYGTLPRQKLDVYEPKGLTAPAPVVIFFYGGDWQNGSKRDYQFVAQALTSKGFVAVVPDYRLYPSVTFPAFVEDGAMAVHWTHDNVSRFGGQGQQVFLMGHSAGAHIAALLTLDEHYLRAVGLDRNVIAATAALSGPYDFIPIPDDRAALGMSRTDAVPPAPIEPINFADGSAPPMLLINGSADTVVDSSNAVKLADRIRQKGGHATTLIYPNVGHPAVVVSLAWSFRWLAPTLSDVTAFFQAHQSRR